MQNKHRILFYLPTPLNLIKKFHKRADEEVSSGHPSADNVR